MAAKKKGGVPIAKSKAIRERAQATKSAQTPTELHIDLSAIIADSRVRVMTIDCTPETENYRHAVETKLQEALVLLQHVRPKT